MLWDRHRVEALVPAGARIEWTYLVCTGEPWQVVEWYVWLE